MVILSVYLLSVSNYAYSIGLSSLQPEAKASANETWEIWRQSPNKTVKKRPAISPEASELIEIRAELTISSSLSGFLLFIEDPSNIANWLDKVDHLSLLRHTATEHTLTLTFDAFWPVKPRIMKVRSTITQLPDRSVQILISDLSQQLASSNQHIAITVHSANWQITPITANQLHIQYQFVADANGSLPNWLAQKFTLNSIWRTLTNIESQLASSKYQAHTHMALKELPTKKSQEH